MSSGEEDEVDSKAGSGRPFTIVDVSSEVPNADTSAAKELFLNDRGLANIDSFESLKNMKKLELRGNKLTELSFLEMNWGLCWLAVARNRLKSITHLNNLSSLAVLDVSDNRIKTLSGLSELSSLKALIATRNRIKRIDELSPKKHPSLETLVLSHNLIEECSLRGFASLKKLSVAHNCLHAFPRLSKLPSLMELRVNGNKIPCLDDAVAQLHQLSILDIGNNLVANMQALGGLRGHLWLKSFNLFGNPCFKDGSAEEQPDVKDFIASFPKLEIFNNRRQDGGEKSAKRRQTKAKMLHKALAGEKEGISLYGKGQQDVAKAAPTVSVHGRSFSGKKKQFADSDEEEEAPKKKKSKAAGESEKFTLEGEVARKKRRTSSEAAGLNKESLQTEAAPSLAVHGRGFGGKARVADSEDEHDHPKRRGKAAGGLGKTKKKKKTKDLVADAASAPPKSTKKAKRRTGNSGD